MQTYTLKFVLVGDSGVGKSQLLRRFVRKEFSHDPKSTLNMEFSTRDIPFERCIVKSQIWDTVGQERFESLTKAYYRDAMGALLVYDVTNMQSFKNMKTVWYKQLKEYGHERMQIVLVGNKLDGEDGGESKRQVSIKEAVEFAKANRMDFVETSALSNKNVECVFRRMILSVAPVIPDINNHLGLTDLPEGWIHVSRTDASIVSNFKPAAAVDVNEDKVQLLTTTPEGENEDINEQYMNFWTGDITNVKPTQPAETCMIYTADPRLSTVSSSFYHRQNLQLGNPINEENMTIVVQDDVDVDAMKGKCNNCNIL